MPTHDVSPRWQLGWFLAIACLPGLFLLALPAVRPSSDPRVVEWTWLAGLVLGVLVPPILLFTRPISFFVRQLQKGLANPWHPTDRVRFSRIRAYCCGCWDRSMRRP